MYKIKKCFKKKKEEKYLPNFSAAANPLTTAIGCFKQNSWSCGLKACFLFSKCTDGVGGKSCSRVKRCGGHSGGHGIGASFAKIEQGGGCSLLFKDLQKKTFKLKKTFKNPKKLIFNQKKKSDNKIAITIFQ